ncbi:CPBP family glutamic-type intramembrane protease [Deinococcus pimensis]|uniref:CPBP family glutamic-type intramembrane protease n=1 Tax=Deinococcus pimensis TaxID=309888 RepID=UPI0004892D43|nr:CPBP family glutamic-type intramembrane protease [Deinococcus pimensis]
MTSLTHGPRTPKPLVRTSLRLAPLAALAVLGVLPVLPSLLGPLVARTPGAPPVAVLTFLSAAQLTVMLALSVLIGAWAAPLVGFRSRLVDRDWSGLRRDVLTALLPALLLGVVLPLLDLATTPLMGDAWKKVAAEQPRGVAVTVSGVVYGGMGEELQMRWALVSLVTFALWKLIARTSRRPPALVVVLAVSLVAVLFGVAHLGAVAALITPTPVMVARTVLLNAVAGVVYGLLFTRRSLESAMTAHAATHLVMTAALLVTWP